MNARLETRNSKLERNAAAFFVLPFLLALASPVAAATIRSKDIEVTVRPGGSGLIDEVKYRGEVVMSATATGRTPTPGFQVAPERATAAARLTGKLAALQVNAPCRMTESTSNRGHKLFTLENGLLRVTAMTWFGGRIIRLESKLTGVNVLDNPYEDRPDEVKEPKDMAGLWGELADGVLQPKVVKQTDDEIALLLSGEAKDGGETLVMRPITCSGGSASVLPWVRRMRCGEAVVVGRRGSGGPGRRPPASPIRGRTTGRRSVTRTKARPY